MAINTVVRARINEQIKEEANIVLEAMGLTISDAFRMLLTKVAREKKLPFSPFIPNAKTVAAIKAAKSGNMITVHSVNGLMSSLNEKD